MSQTEPTTIDELQSLLEELEALAPPRESLAGTSVVYRPVASDEVIDDAMLPEEPADLGDNEFELSPIPQVSEFQQSRIGPMAAVDCGIVRLGETENGLVIALRATLVIDRAGDSQVRTFRTGPIYLHNRHKAQVLYQIGKHLGKPDFFVEIDVTDPTSPHPTIVKSGVADDSHQYGDRFRTWLERLVQRIAVTSIENGIILFDGALTLRTRDAPAQFLQDLARQATSKGNAVIGISKQSLLQVRGKPIRFWLNDSPNRACYRILSALMRKDQERQRVERILGNLYAVRFSPLGPTFRMDVKAADGQSDDEAIGQLFGSALMRGGYPDILVRAHSYSYFTSPDVIQLQAQAGAKFGLVPEGEVDLAGIFAPFGGRFK
jgi:hypothetical protein